MDLDSSHGVLSHWAGWFCVLKVSYSGKNIFYASYSSRCNYSEVV